MFGTSEQRNKRGVVRGASIEAFAGGGPIIEAHDLELKRLLGCPYSRVNLSVEQGQVFAIRGRNGSGKTALLLTLAGRMLFTKGTLTVAGFKLPRNIRQVQKRVGLALFEGQNDLPDTQLVGLAVAAEFELYGRRPSKEDTLSYLDEWDLGPCCDMRVSELKRRQLVQLGIALAWVSHPDIIVVDDIESQLTKSQSIEIMNRLIDISRKRNVTVVVGVLERDLASMADGALYLEKPDAASPNETTQQPKADRRTATEQE